MVKEGAEYRHGGDPEKDFARFGLCPGPVLDFSVNLNPLGPPKIVSQEWEHLKDLLMDYPPLEGEGVSRFYCERFGIPQANCLPGNGSTEIIYLLPRVLGLRDVLVVTPSYHDYERASVLVGARVRRLQLNPENLFQPPELEQVVERAKNSDAIWIGRPNNPTGTMISKEIIFELSRACPDKWILVDEAFIQFLDNWDQETLLLERPRQNILVIHSLTKFYALAGLRLGGFYADSSVVARAKNMKEPWTVNAVADRVAVLLSGSEDYEEETRKRVAEEMGLMAGALARLDGIMPFPTSVNFMLCKWTGTDTLDDLLRYLLANGMYVRDCRNFPGLEDNFFRIGLRGAEDNKKLVQVISSF